MATKEIKPGMIFCFQNQAQGAQSDVLGIKQAPSGQWPVKLQAQVIAEAGNSAFSVTISRSFDQGRSFQVVATITTAAISEISITTGFIRIDIGTATGGPVSVYLGVS